MERPYLIGEIGINHNGSLEVAKQLMFNAASLKWDAVKFQKRTIDVVYSQNFLDSPRHSPWGTTQRHQKEGLEFGSNEYDVIDNYAEELNLEWSASAWDIESLVFLDRYNLAFHKIASAMLTNIEFVNEVANRGKLTYISTGMSSISDIDKVVQTFQDHKTEFVLMHTVSTYPAHESTLNLACIPTLARRYNCRVGYSGHEVSVSPSIVAASLGACVIERHITLDRAMYGSDQSSSLEYGGMQQLSNIIHKLPSMIGDGIKTTSPEEQDVASKLRYWRVT